MTYAPVSWETSKSPGDTISLPWPYANQSNVYIVVGGVEVSTSLFQWTSSNTIECLTGFPTGAGYCERWTTRTLPSEQQGSGSFNWQGANNNDKTLLYIQQELDYAETARQAVTDELVEKYDNIDTLVGTATTKAAEASSSATAAAGSASAASGSATSAASSATAAGTSETNAAASASTATTKASEASTSATAAAGSASTATTKASEASTSETNAAASASTATTKASEASASATASAGSASAAAASATNAATSETNAATSAANALASENNVALMGVRLGQVMMRFTDLPDDGYLTWGEGGTWTRGVHPEFDAHMDAHGAKYGLTPTMIANGQKPDFRNYSPRTAGGALGPAVGALQEDAFQGHWHNVDGQSGGGATGFTIMYSAGGTDVVTLIDAKGPVSDGANGTPRTATETRVKSFGVRWQIKAYGAYVNEGTADLVAIEQGYATLSSGALRKDIDQSAGYGVPEKVNILKNTLQAWEAIGGLIDVTSDVSSVDWTGLGAYRSLRLTGRALPATNNQNVGFRVGAGGFDTSAMYNTLATYTSSAPSGPTVIWLPTETKGYLTINGVGNDDATRGGDFVAIFDSFNKAKRTKVNAQFGGTLAGGQVAQGDMYAEHSSAVALDSLRIMSADAAGIKAGSYFILEGLRG